MLTYTTYLDDNGHSSALEAFCFLAACLTMYLRHVVICQQPHTLDFVIFYMSNSGTQENAADSGNDLKGS